VFQRASQLCHCRQPFMDQVTHAAVERDETKRTAFRERMSRIITDPRQVVYLDESGVNRHTTRRAYAYAPCGERARSAHYFVCGVRYVYAHLFVSYTNYIVRYAVLPAISLDGVLQVDVLTDKAWAGDEFYTFVDRLTATKMNPYPQANSVLVMDNCSTHHVEGIRELVESR
jgi:hypothetical protein